MYAAWLTGNRNWVHARLLGALAVVVQVSVLGWAGEHSVDIVALEKRIIESRRSIKQAIVHIESKNVRWAHGKRSLFHTRKTVWLDGESVRADTVYEHAGGYRDVECIAKNWHTKWSSATPDGRKLAIMRNSYARSATPNLAFDIADFRCIGMLPTDTPSLVHFNVESMIGRPDRTGLQAKRELIGTEKCWRIEYTRSDNCQIRYWLAELQDLNPLRMECSFTANGTSYLDSVTCTVERTRWSGIWFPRSCRYERHENEALTEEEDVEIIVESFNEPVNSRVFELAGMGIPGGTLIFQHPRDSRGESIWDGEKERSTRRDYRGVAENEQTRQLLLATTGVVLAVIAAFAFRRYSKRRA